MNEQIQLEDDNFDFSSLEVIEIPVRAPNGDKFTLKQASTRVAKEHRNEIMRCTKFGPDGHVTGVQDLASVEPKFVAGCLYSESGKNPAVVLVESWPATMVKKLYEKAKLISHVNETSPIADSLKKALSLSGSPIQFSDLCTFIKTLKSEDPDLRPIIRLLAGADDEEEVKN